LLKEGTALKEGFMATEGERIFSFISQKEQELKDQDVMFCIMHSPLPEAVVLWLWKHKTNSIVAKTKTLADIRMLDYLDAFILFFREGQIVSVYKAGLREKVAEKLREEALKMKRG